MRIVSKDLKFTYNKKTEFFKQALRGVDLVIEEGDFFGIIGHTGSGKSTFIQHLNGLIPVQEGSLTIGEFDLSANEKRNKKEFTKTLKQLRGKVGMVFQYPEYQLFAETVFADVAFGLKNFQPEIKDDEVIYSVKTALEAVGLNYNEVKDKSPFDLSGGQKRRVAIAGVLVTKPEVLILDEPVAGLDPIGKKQLMKILHSIHGKEVKTIVIVSHDMDEVCENCNKIAIFSEGKVIKEGDPSVIFASPNELSALRLDVPITSKIANKLKEIGVDITTNYKTDDFIKAVENAYYNKIKR